MTCVKAMTRAAILGAAFGVLAIQSARVEAADDITFVTDFGFNGRHAYYYVALEKGYYRDANLNVKIVRGQGSSDAVKQVAAGTAQIGFADTSAVIFGQANDQIPVKIVSVVYSKPPHAIYVLKDRASPSPRIWKAGRLPTRPSARSRKCSAPMPRRPASTSPR